MGRLRGTLGPWLGLAALLCLAHAARAAFQLTILHTNDVHARVEQTSRDSGKCQTRSGGGPPDCYGGVARRYTKIREIRATHPNVLLLDAGDQYQGTVWFSYFKGREAARFMNFLGYDAMVRGRRLAGGHGLRQGRAAPGQLGATGAEVCAHKWCMIGGLPGRGAAGEGGCRGLVPGKGAGRGGGQLQGNRPHVF